MFRRTYTLTFVGNHRVIWSGYCCLLLATLGRKVPRGVWNVAWSILNHGRSFWGPYFLFSFGFPKETYGK